jgi:hypothetical protein
MSEYWFMLIGLLVGVLSCSHIFPNGKTFWKWIWTPVENWMNQDE